MPSGGHRFKSKCINDQIGGEMEDLQLHMQCIKWRWLWYRQRRK